VVPVVLVLVEVEVLETVVLVLVEVEVLETVVLVLVEVEVLVLVDVVEVLSASRDTTGGSARYVRTHNSSTENSVDPHMRMSVTLAYCDCRSPMQTSL